MEQPSLNHQYVLPDIAPDQTMAADITAFNLDDSFFVSIKLPRVIETPFKLFDITANPQLSMSTFVSLGLDSGDFQKELMMQSAVACVAITLEVTADILHPSRWDSEDGPQRGPTSRARSQLIYWVERAVPEFAFHAGSTPYARVHYVMTLLEHFVVSLPIAWAEILACAENDRSAMLARSHIVEAVKRNNQPQASLSHWALTNLFPELEHVEHHLQAESEAALRQNGEYLASRRGEQPHGEVETRAQLGLETPESTQSGSTCSVQSFGTEDSSDGWHLDPGHTVRSQRRREVGGAKPNYNMDYHQLDDTLGVGGSVSRKRKRSSRECQGGHRLEAKVVPDASQTITVDI